MGTNDFKSWDDYLYWQTQNRKTLKKINSRLEAGRPLADLLQDMLVGAEPAINKSAGSSG